MIKNLLQNTTQLAQAIWAHYLSPQLASGAYAAVDATCGRGNDTVWLAARCGRVYAFDIQPDAIASTREALQAAGIADAQILSQAQASQLAAGGYLFGKACDGISAAGGSIPAASENNEKKQTT